MIGVDVDVDQFKLLGGEDQEGPILIQIHEIKTMPEGFNINIGGQHEQLIVGVDGKLLVVVEEEQALPFMTMRGFDIGECMVMMNLL